MAAPPQGPLNKLITDQQHALNIFWFCVLDVIGAVIASIVWGRGTEVLIGGLIVIGEAAVMRRDPRRGVPLSHAHMLAAIRVDTVPTAAAIIIPAQIIARFLHPRDKRVGRISVLLQRLWTSAAAIAAAEMTHRAFNAQNETVAQALLTVLAAVGAQWVADEVFCLLTDHRFRRSLLERSAELGVGSTGILMAIGAGGINGEQRLYAWAPLVLSIPLMGAWLAADRASSLRRAYRQTVSALSGAVEMGGFVPSGESHRIADVCEVLARKMHVSFMARETLRTAALLRNLGRTTLDDVEGAMAMTNHEASLLTSTILEPDEGMLDVAEAMVGSTEGPNVDWGYVHEESHKLAQILRVATDFVELTLHQPALQDDVAVCGDCVAELFGKPEGTYDVRVLRHLRNYVGAELGYRERRAMYRHIREQTHARRSAVNHHTPTSQAA